MKHKYLHSFDGAKIYYHLTPRNKNKWLIFLHGLGGDLTAWQTERRFFDKKGISTIALDLRGHGLSERKNEKSFYHLENYAKDLLFLIEKEKIHKPVVVGHCFGGMISIYFGAKYQKQSQGLVLIDTSYKIPFFGDHFVEKTLLELILNLFEKVTPTFKLKGHVNYNHFFGTPDLSLKRLLTDVLHTSLRSYLLIVENLVEYDASELLNMIQVPSLVVSGLKDSIFPPSIEIMLQERIKKSELDFIENGNHILVINNPAQLEESISSFLTKIKF